MPLYGLIGYPLTHSFSRRYFTEKFRLEGNTESDYLLFEMEDAKDFPALFVQYPNLKGLNVTIPHKIAVIPFLDRVDEGAMRVGAVNVIRREADGSLTGFNSDYIGFLRSLRSFMGAKAVGVQALVLGTGGAAAAVRVALEDMHIEYLTVSRTSGKGGITYADLKNEPSMVQQYLLIVNTSPVGTYPAITQCPDIPYQFLTKDHLLFDLVYNPEQTLFMKKGLERGASVKNGYEMLVLQAERAWEIWNENS